MNRKLKVCLSGFLALLLLLLTIIADTGLLPAEAEEPQATGDSGTYSIAQIKAVQSYLQTNPDACLLDTTGMDKNAAAPWYDASTLYQCNVNGGSQFVGKSQKIDGTNIFCFDLSGAADDNGILFSYSGDWSTANGNDYHKTINYTAGELRGRLYRAVGEAQSTSGDDNGRYLYTLEEVTFERSPLSGKTVYLDTANIEGMGTPPVLSVTEEDGTVSTVEMTQCYNQEGVYSYTFADYVLPGTTFRFQKADGTQIPDAAVADIAADTPCYDGSVWVAYTPEASTVSIYVKHNFSDKGGAVVVFTKNGTATGRTIEIGTSSGAFQYDFAEDSYDGFYVKQRDDSQTGNTTVTASEIQEIRAAVETYGNKLMVTLGGWIDTSTPRTLTFSAYVSLADSSLNIPSGTFHRDEGLYYVQSTFYDYYSDEEIAGNNRKNLAASFNHNSGSSSKVQATTFNKAVSDYFQGTSLASGTAQSPLYFGELTEAGSYTGGLNNFVWENNNGEPNKVGSAAGARQGLVNSSLNSSHQLTMGSEDIIAPYFNEAFLRGDNSTGAEIGYVFPNIQFPFVQNDEGYWEFNSGDSSQTLRMKQDTNGRYFLDRVGADNAVHGMIFQNNSAQSTSKSNFFPFNDAGESCQGNVGNANRLNYAFGARLDIPFYMTSDGQVTMVDSNNQSTKKDIVFDFSGDDDVWIFIDDQLVLDIGGDHGEVTGQINFAACTATTTTNQNSAMSFSRLSDTEQHTLTMFWMERGLWESNMKITFNFPQANQLTVEKEVVVPDDVNPYFAEAMEILKTDTTFPVQIQNMVTSGETVALDGTTPAVDMSYDPITAGSDIALDTPKSSAVAQVLTSANPSGRTEVLHYYYPGEKRVNDGQSVTDARSLYVTGPPLDIGSDQLKNYGYIQFDAYVDSGSQASSPFVALIDSSGNRIGAWASGAVHGGGSNSMGSRNWKTIRVDISKLSQLTGSSFDYQHVEKVQIAYWDDVNIYLDDIRIMAPAKYAATTGFSKEQKDIPDYGSYVSKQLEDANGAEYVQTGMDEKQNVDAGYFYLKSGDKVIFSDQFRRESYVGLREICDNTIFDTTWELYEDSALHMTGSGTVVDDGRTEPSPELADRGKPENSILFKTFDEEAGESLTRYFDLRVKYINTLRTGNLVIRKQLKDGQTPNGDTYTFKVYFSNIAGRALEDQLAAPLTPMTIELAANETVEIKGIPAGTYYNIIEVPKEGQVFRVDEIVHSGNDSADHKPDENAVSGTVLAPDPGDTDQYDLYSFTNDIKMSTNVKITKVDAADTAITLENVSFELQKLKEDGSIDDTFAKQTATTSAAGIAGFTDLEQGTYQLTEVKTAEDYSLLKEPITIVLNRSGTGSCTVNGTGYEVVDDTISITVSNRRKFSFPATGGYGALLVTLTGILIADFGWFLFELYQYRKYIICKRKGKL